MRLAAIPRVLTASWHLLVWVAPVVHGTAVHAQPAAGGADALLNALGSATPTPASSTPTNHPAPNLVRLRDGSEFRGHILERTAMGVTLRLPTGEARHFDATQIVYAGADGREHSSIQAKLSDPRYKVGYVGPRATVRLVSPDSHSIRVFTPRQIEARTDTFITYGDYIPFAAARHDTVGHTWLPLCTTPCTLRVPVGNLRLGAQEEGDDEVRPLRPLYVERDRTLEVDASPNPLGTILLYGGGALSIAGLLVAATLDKNDPESTKLRTGVISLSMIVTGAVVSLVGLAMDRESGSLREHKDTREAP